MVHRRSSRRRGLPLLASSLGVIGVVLVGILLSISGGGSTAVDSAWHDLMRNARSETGIAIASSLDVLGGVGPMLILGIVLTAALLIMRRPWDALTLAAAMILSEVATGILKVLVARPRPADSLSDTGLMSFPSGHTTIAATTMVVLAILIGRRFWIVAAAWVALIAWSRTFLEAHWLTDVVAGAVLGTSVAILVCGVAPRVRRAARSRMFAEHRDREHRRSRSVAGR